MHSNSNNISNISTQKRKCFTHKRCSQLHLVHTAAGTTTRWRTSLQLGSDPQLFLRQDKMAGALCRHCSPSPSPRQRKTMRKNILKAGASVLCCSLFQTAPLCWFNSTQCCCFGLLRSLHSAGFMLSLDSAPLTSVCQCFVSCGRFWFKTIGSQILEPLSAVFDVSWRNRKEWNRMVPFQGNATFLQNHASQQWSVWYRTAIQPRPHSPKTPPPANKFRVF